MAFADFSDGQMASGTEFLVQYVGGYPEWHARFLLGVVHRDTWIVLTPDFDVFVEEYGIANRDIARRISPNSDTYYPEENGVRDIARWRRRPTDRSAPYGVVRAFIYDFRFLPSESQMAALLQEGAVRAAAERARRFPRGANVPFGDPGVTSVVPGGARGVGGSLPASAAFAICGGVGGSPAPLITDNKGTPRGGDHGVDTLRPRVANNLAVTARPDAPIHAADTGDSEAVVLAAMSEIFNTATVGEVEPSSGCSSLRERVADILHEQHDSNNDSDESPVRRRRLGLSEAFALF